MNGIWQGDEMCRENKTDWALFFMTKSGFDGEGGRPEVQPFG